MKRRRLIRHREWVRNDRGNISYSVYTLAMASSEESASSSDLQGDHLVRCSCMILSRVVHRSTDQCLTPWNDNYTSQYTTACCRRAGVQEVGLLTAHADRFATANDLKGPRHGASRQVQIGGTTAWHQPLRFGWVSVLFRCMYVCMWKRARDAICVIYLYLYTGAIWHLRNDRAVTSRGRADKRDTCFHIYRYTHVYIFILLFLLEVTLGRHFFDVSLHAGYLLYVHTLSVPRAREFWQREFVTLQDEILRDSMTKRIWLALTMLFGQRYTFQRSLLYF